ncbi:hypothetical protein [Cellulomonas fengjieae]|uniref:DUF4232 domain-containing protein n=1 Tax=Cellulomonas fengjieae TaxID=2819978 RepID=A0ABS3SH93_9CELL|nr:hypothetical protein [Cellulomonas fengjieae]MBO3085121.1 hypothetical protein [Cellulomonas fengjieae]QVI66300.1 hypothetical protein KG102_01365 [Cellulomonas fengjieae]
MSQPGRLPARVYWVRRLVVLGIPLAIIAVVVWLLVGRGSDEDPAPVGQTPSAPAQEPQSETPAEGGVPDCDASGLVLAMTPDATSYAPGVSATFSVSITNSGADPCLVDAGEVQREIVITSGTDRIWSNRDCIVPGTETRTLLLPGGGTDTTPFAWNRVRSAEGCPTGLPTPGAGTYSAQLNLAGAGAPAAVFGLG